MKQLNTKIVLRNDIYSAWESANPILLKGEVGIEYDPSAPQEAGVLDYKVKIKIGDGVNKWSDLPYFGGDSEVIEDINSAVDSLIEELGDAETEGSVIYRVGTLETEIAESKEAIAKHDGEIIGLTNHVNGIITELEQKANAEDVYTKTEVADVISEAMANADHLRRVIIDTATLAQYQADPSLAEKNVIYMVKVNSLIKDSYQEFMRFDSAIGAVSFEQIGDTSVDLADYAKVSDVEAQMVVINNQFAALPELFIGKENISEFAQTAKFEVTNTPVGTLVNIEEDEVRIMCPANTQWSKQSVGATGNANMYYMGFKAYAPKGAVGFKEGDRGVIVDEYFDFTGDFAGTDEHGRNYSICWLALASYDEASDTWTYFGKNSSVEKYIGWDYIVEWYNIDGVVIASDSIRINLSNEACHHVSTPYYVGSLTRLINDKASIADLDNLTKIIEDKASQSDLELVVDAVNGKADKATTLAGYEITDAYTKDEITKLLNDITGGESAADVLTALENYKASNDAAVNALDTKMDTIEEGAQVNKIESIIIEGADSALPIVNKTVSLPAATMESIGLVKLSNEIGVNANNALEVKTININKIVQDEEDTLILDGGSALK